FTVSVEARTANLYVFKTCSRLKKNEAVEDKGFAKPLFGKELASFFRGEWVGPNGLSKRFEHDPGATGRSSGHPVRDLRLIVPAIFSVRSSASRSETCSENQAGKTYFSAIPRPSLSFRRVWSHSRRSQIS